MKPRLIVIAGPTASGKTSCAIQLAQKWGCPIVSADSRQLYRELNIGVARPSLSELEQAEHHLIASHSIHAPLNAGSYAQTALALINQLHTQHQTVILCGGTGLYIKALIEGLDPLPHNPSVRRKFEELFKLKGIEGLQHELQILDPLFYKHAERSNPQRMIRYLELAELTNKSNLDLREQKKQERPFITYYYWLNIEREELNMRINQRVEQMIEQGLEAEVTQLLPYSQEPLLKTVGYSEFFAYLKQEITLQECVEQIKVNTRRYAKRQRTWFKNQANAIAVSGCNEILKH